MLDVGRWNIRAVRVLIGLFLVAVVAGEVVL
jgi:hypothetical protein